MEYGSEEPYHLSALDVDSRESLKNFWSKAKLTPGLVTMETSDLS